MKEKKEKKEKGEKREMKEEEEKKVKKGKRGKEKKKVEKSESEALCVKSRSEKEKRIDFNLQGIEPSREGGDEEETSPKRSFTASEDVANEFVSLVIDESRVSEPSEDSPDDFEKLVAEEDAAKEDYVFA